jgi:predicted nicotinamide N-methyase
VAQKKLKVKTRTADEQIVRFCPIWWGGAGDSRHCLGRPDSVAERLNRLAEAAGRELGDDPFGAAAAADLLARVGSSGTDPAATQVLHLTGAPNEAASGDNPSAAEAAQQVRQRKPLGEGELAVVASRRRDCRLMS